MRSMAPPDVQEEAELVRLPAMTRRLVRARRELHVLDQVLHAPARAVDLLVQDLGSDWRASGTTPVEAGDDEAGVRPQVRRLDAGHDRPGLAPGPGTMLKLMEAAHLAGAG
jgi:hypothetical protein